jgi:hypothetical protein
MQKQTEFGVRAAFQFLSLSPQHRRLSIDPKFASHSSSLFLPDHQQRSALRRTPVRNDQPNQSRPPGEASPQPMNVARKKHALQDKRRFWSHLQQRNVIDVCMYLRVSSGDVDRRPKRPDWRAIVCKHLDHPHRNEAAGARTFTQHNVWRSMWIREGVARIRTFCPNATFSDISPLIR